MLYLSVTVKLELFTPTKLTISIINFRFKIREKLSLRMAKNNEKLGSEFNSMPQRTLDSEDRGTNIRMDEIKFTSSPPHSAKLEEENELRLDSSSDIPSPPVISGSDQRDVEGDRS